MGINDYASGTAGYSSAEHRIIDAVGDGNCGPRAVIQSMLIQGIVTGKQKEVVAFLTTIYDSNKDTKDSQGRSLYAYHQKTDSSKTDPVQQKQTTDFLAAYATMTKADLPHLNQYFGAKTGSANVNNDPVIYVLAGCLRFEMNQKQDFLSASASKDDKEERETWNTLEAYTDMSNMIGPLRAYGFNFNMKSQDAEVNRTFNIIKEGLPQALLRAPLIDISINMKDRNHYQTVVEPAVFLDLTAPYKALSPTTVTAIRDVGGPQAFVNQNKLKNHLMQLKNPINVESTNTSKSLPPITEFNNKLKEHFKSNALGHTCEAKEDKAADGTVKGFTITSKDNKGNELKDQTINVTNEGKVTAYVPKSDDAQKALAEKMFTAWRLAGGDIKQLESKITGGTPSMIKALIAVRNEYLVSHPLSKLASVVADPQLNQQSLKLM